MKSDISEYIEQIPDYHHKLLKGHALEMFETALDSSKTLREEYDEFMTFEKLYQEIDPSSPEPSEKVFNRIMASIDSAEESITPKSVEASFSYFALLTKALTNTITWLKESFSFPWALTAVQAIVICLLLLPTFEDEKYNTLSIKNITQHSGVTVNLVFKETAKELEIRQLLVKIGASIISGPSNEGRYIVAIPNKSNSKKAVQFLHQSNIVQFVSLTQ